MATAFDGSIRIDTSVDARGMQKGTRNITASLSGVVRSLRFVAAAMGIAFSGAFIFRFIKDTMSQFDIMASSVGGNIVSIQSAFAGLRGAIANAGVTLLTVLTPHIIAAIQWLTQLFNILSAIIRVLFGVSGAMGAVAQSTGGAVGQQKKLGDETKKAGKAAKGALAAFDQLNVLQQEQPDAPTDLGGAGGGAGALPALAVPPELMDRLEQFKTKVLEFLSPVIEGFGRLKEALIPLGETIWSGLKWAWDNILVPFGTWVFQDALPVFLDILAAGARVLNSALIALRPLGLWLWENFLKPLGQFTGEVIITALEWLVERLNALSDWINENPEKFQKFATIIGILVAAWVAFSVILMIVGALFNAWIVITGVATTVATVFGAVIAFLASPIGLVILAILALIAIIVVLIKYWPQITEAAKACWVTIQQLWFIAGHWFKTNVTDPIKAAFFTALDLVKQRFEAVFNGIKSFVRGVVNGIIDLINGMIRGIGKGMNAVISGFNIAGKFMPGFKPLPSVAVPQIPRLAKGAVIPPNAAFAAVLGDQKSGRNLEAPEGLIRQILREELGRIEADININFTGTLGALVRELKPHIDKENVRIGGSLIKRSIGT